MGPFPTVTCGDGQYSSGGCHAVSGTLQDSLQSADVTTVNSTAVTLSLTPEEPECRLEPHRTETSSGGHMPTG